MEQAGNRNPEGDRVDDHSRYTRGSALVMLLGPAPRTLIDTKPPKAMQSRDNKILRRASDHGAPANVQPVGASVTCGRPTCQRLPTDSRILWQQKDEQITQLTTQLRRKEQLGEKSITDQALLMKLQAENKGLGDQIKIAEDQSKILQSLEVLKKSLKDNIKSLKAEHISSEAEKKSFEAELISSEAKEKSLEGKIKIVKDAIESRVREGLI
ncbi:hypothetical protein LTS10_013117 [Elasticomyces elasticus]|nr:hypothetical protein LTS10_013117 [Elasticomyces elasticus]